MEMTYKIPRYRCRLVKDGRALQVEANIVDCAESAARLFRPVFRDLPHEEVWIALLNARNSVMGLVRAGQGGLHGCALKPCDILRPVVVVGACGFVMAHNHPSGDPTPSQEDREMTRVLLRASETMGVGLLDHVILTREGPWQALRTTLGGFGD